jgi:membrane-associated phospholipid phosphatase
MSSSTWRPLLAVCASLLPFVSSAQAPATFHDTLGIAQPAADAPAPIFRHPRPGSDLRSWVIHWNEVAINASGVDHTPVAAGEDRVFGEQIGPGRSARALAIVQIAVFDSLIAINGGYQSYTDIARVRSPASTKAAVAIAAHDTLAALFPSQRRTFHQELMDSVRRLRGESPTAIANGILAGKRAATAILNLRKADGSQHKEPVLGVDHNTSNEAGHWRQDPVSLSRVALGAHWGAVKPFVMKSGQQFRAPPPPAMTSAQYTEAFNEVKRLGGDAITTTTERTEDQTFAGLFWAYDGMPSLCAPPRLYNQIAVEIAKQRRTGAVGLARLLALMNVAQADAGIAIWESKFFYDFWRPVGGVREADVGMGPSGAGDGNADTIADPNFMPLGAPGSNLSGPNFTPPFPSYPSGHAGFGGALFQVLRRFYGTDDIAFTFVSDEFNGVTRDNNGNVRPLRPRSFNTLSAAEEENGQSRIYLGIHWSFDKSDGITQGQQIADYVWFRTYRPTR